MGAEEVGESLKLVGERDGVAVHEGHLLVGHEATGLDGGQVLPQLRVVHVGRVRAVQHAVADEVAGVVGQRLHGDHLVGLVALHHGALDGLGRLQPPHIVEDGAAAGEVAAHGVDLLGPHLQDGHGAVAHDADDLVFHRGHLVVELGDVGLGGVLLAHQIGDVAEQALVRARAVGDVDRRRDLGVLVVVGLGNGDDEVRLLLGDHLERGLGRGGVQRLDAVAQPREERVVQGIGARDDRFHVHGQELAEIVVAHDGLGIGGNLHRPLVGVHRARGCACGRIGAGSAAVGRSGALPSCGGTGRRGAAAEHGSQGGSSEEGRESAAGNRGHGQILSES